MNSICIESLYVLPHDKFESRVVFLRLFSMICKCKLNYIVMIRKMPNSYSEVPNLAHMTKIITTITAAALF